MEFFPSADHNTVLADGRPAVTKYLFEVYMAGASAPFQSTDMGKPTPQTDGVIRYDFSSQVAGWPLPGGVYESRVAAVGPNGTVRSQASNQFTFTIVGTCAFTVSPTSGTIGSGGGTLAVSVSTTAGCSWSATSNASWMSVTPASGSGGGSVTLTAVANGITSARTGWLTVAGQTVTITQDGIGCSYTVSPTVVLSASSGASQTIAVTTASGCFWSVSSNAGWATVAPASGTGSGSFTTTIGSNTSFQSRSAVLTIAGRSVNVTQSAMPAAPQSGDYDGDGRDDVGVFRPAAGTWYQVPSTTGQGKGVSWGVSSDVPVPADYDGDGKTDVAVYRPGTGVWFIVRSSSGTAIGPQWGAVGDIPVPADYDGDLKADIAVFRPSTGVWYIVRSSSGSAIGTSWGVSGDVPVPADYDGDRRADPTVFRPSTGTWYELRSAGGPFGFNWGQAGDIPLAADYDGDGVADPAVFRPSSGTWFQLRSTNGRGFGVSWGASGDLPVIGDYDGDGRADPAVFRPSSGTWYQLRSTTGTGHGIGWGVLGDWPI